MLLLKRDNATLYLHNPKGFDSVSVLFFFNICFLHTYDLGGNVIFCGDVDLHIECYVLHASAEEVH